MRYFAAAYATTPCSSHWNQNAEAAFYQGLKEIPSLRGLEVPFTGVLHPHDQDWLINALVPDWDVVLTLLPGTMDRLAARPAFGLASEDEAGREAALAFAAQAQDAVKLLNDRAGRRRVVAVETHSAPRKGAGVASSAAAFSRSLREIATWDWQGAALLVEHCDAWTPATPPIKGFLTLAEEISAITAANAQTGPAGTIGVVLNWGRSVLEVRDPLQPLRHIAQVRQAGLPLGVIFSGCSGEDGPWGIWQDTHMPHAPSAACRYGAPGSLLDAQAIAKAVEAAGPDVLFLGGKLTARPTLDDQDADIARRVGLNRDLLSLIDAAQQRK